MSLTNLEVYGPSTGSVVNDLLVYIPLSTNRGRGGWSVVVVVGVEVGIVGVAVKRATDVLAAVVGREVVVV